MAETVQQDFRLLYQSYKNIKALRQRLGTALDNAAVRTRLTNELRNSESIADRMTGNIEQIENKAKRDKLGLQLRKTKEEIHILMNEIEREKRLSWIEENKPVTVSDRSRLSVKQKVEWQSYDDIQEVEEQNAAVLKIQKDTEHLAEAYNSLRDLVNEQNPDVIAIEKHAEEVNQNVKAAVKEIDKTLNVHKSRRKKTCVIVLCLIILGGLIAFLLVDSNTINIR